MPRYIQHPSLVTHWVEGALEPVPDAAGPTETVWFALPHDPDTEETWEGLLARPETDDELTLVAVPVYLYDVNFGDRVKAIRSAEGPYVAVGVAQKSGASTFRALITSDLPDAWHGLSSELAEQGCLVDVMSPNLIAFSCPADHAQGVAGRLSQLQEEGFLEYETGQTASSDDGRP